MLWHVHVIVKGAKVSPPQTVQTVDLLLSGPLLTFTQVINPSIQWGGLYTVTSPQSYYAPAAG